MTCSYFSALCVLCSLVMTSSVGSRSIDSKSRVIPPVIIEGPNFHVYFKPDNDRIFLPCKATGTHPIVYMWFWNGVRLEISGRISTSDGMLIMHTPSKNMEGYYQCFASNDAGVTMSNITFFQAAVMESSQSSRERTTAVPRSVVEAEPLVLSCSHVTKSIPSPGFQWTSKVKGNFLPVQPDSRIQQTSDGRLVFSFVRKNDNAVYKCSAYNSAIQMFLDGSRVDLTIEASDISAMERKAKEPPALLFSTADETIVEGENLTLTCLFGSWPLGYEVEWTTPSGSISVSGSSIMIENASVQDQGVYQCRARKTMTEGSQLFSQMVNISVQVDEIPSFTIFPSNQMIVVGQSVTFTCQGQGRPSPIVTWYANGSLVDEIKDTENHFTFFEERTAFLVLKGVNATASVTCNISNVHGYRLHTAMITFANENDIDTTNPSSQILKSSPELSSTLTKTSTKTYHRFNIDSNQTDSQIEFPPTHSPQMSEATIVTRSLIGVAVGLFVFTLAVIFVIIYVRQRKKREGEPVVSQEYRLRRDILVVNNERVPYDSDDSGFDDLRTENNERRNLRQQ